MSDDENRIEMWVTAEPRVRGIDGDEDGYGGVAGPVLRRISLPKSALQEKLREIQVFLNSVADSITDSRIRLDEVEVSFAVGNDGALKWIMGASVSGAAKLKFKVEPKKSQSS